jgi:hypothetical protein
MRRRILRLLVIVGTLLVTVLIGVSLAYARPVLFRTYRYGAISEQPIAFFNPLRDRTPERVGDAVLKQMKSGEYNQVLEPFVRDAERREHLYMRETEYPVESWVLGDHLDDNEGVTLLYWARRKNFNYP